MKHDEVGVERASRFQASLPASFQADGSEVACTATNLSRTGVLLGGRFPIPSESEIWLTLSSHGGDLRLTTGARVMRFTQDAETEQTELGVEFLEIQPVDRPTLEALIARVVEGVLPAAFEQLPPHPTPQQIRAALESVPLPHRISLAGRAKPKEREILIRDSNVQVIDALARNPTLLPHEVVTILRLPTLIPHAIETIANDPRWAGNEQVMHLVATHRSTPFPVADRIVSRMTKTALQRALRAPDLKTALRAKILTRLPRR